jgi:hypothetical protein
MIQLDCVVKALVVTPAAKQTQRAIVSKLLRGKRIVIGHARRQRVEIYRIATLETSIRK